MFFCFHEPHSNNFKNNYLSYWYLTKKIQNPLSKLKIAKIKLACCFLFQQLKLWQTWSKVPRNTPYHLLPKWGKNNIYNLLQKRNHWCFDELHVWLISNIKVVNLSFILPSGISTMYFGSSQFQVMLFILTSRPVNDKCKVLIKEAVEY